MKDIPIYFTGALAQKSLSVFWTFRNMVGNEVKKELDKGNDPFQFKSNDENLDGPDPLIIMTGPGML